MIDEQRKDKIVATISPYLHFGGNTEAAFTFYKSVFGGELLGVLRFRDFGDNSMNVPEQDLNKIAHIALPLNAHTMLMGTDVLESLGNTLNVGNNIFINIEVDSSAEAERLFTALSEGGNVEMPLRTTEWAEQNGSCGDRFGVHWMLNYTGKQVLDMPQQD